jgi:hypothetical protein
MMQSPDDVEEIEAEFEGDPEALVADENEGGEESDEVAEAEETLAAAPQKRPSTYTYPWPCNRQKSDGVPKFIDNSKYVSSVALVEAETRKTYRAKIAREQGVNFGTCLMILPYWDTVRAFAMDVLHDVYLGPVKAALQETFGRANQSETSIINKKLTLRLPKRVGELISNAIVALQPTIPAERSVRLKPPHSKHQYFKGSACLLYLSYYGRC